MSVNVHGSFSWNELRTRNMEETRAYYAKLLGWSFEEAPMEGEEPPYYLCKAGDQVVAGMMEMSEKSGFPDEVPAHWLAYIQVDDVDQCLQLAKSENSEIYFGPVDIPGVGRIAVMQDKAGAPIGLVTPAEPV